MMLLDFNENSLSTKSFAASDFLESIFFQGNGYMGTRGFSCEDSSFRPHQKGVYMAGVFDQLKPGITDMVNTPNFLPLTVKLGSQDLGMADICNFEQTLDFSSGILKREYTASFDGKHIHFSISRFLSLHDVHTACIRIEVIPLDFDDELTVTASLDASSCNLPINDDQVKKNLETVQYLNIAALTPTGSGGSISLKTKGTGLTIFQAFETILSDNIVVRSTESLLSDRRLDCNVTFSAKKNEPYIIDKIITVFTSRDVPDDRVETEVLKRLSLNIEKGYEKLLDENRTEWNKRWETADIVIKGDVKAQCAVRYNIFQLIGNNSRNDSRVSIGARGLTHARYKGCYFWDTEIFLLPFFIYTDPEAARNLLLYRFHTLDAARKHSQKMSTKGARYPWMTSFDGSEQCESWDIGACEVHITCDVVFAMDQYIGITGDTQFLLDYAAEIYLETARFWESRFSYDAAHDKYNLLFVKGPDEYCGAAKNNTYTNILAVCNLNLALETLAILAEQQPEIYNELTLRLNIMEDETLKWREIAQKAVIPFDTEKGLLLQDEDFMLLEPLDIQIHKTDNIPLYHKISFDRLQRYQVLKQADLVLLMVLYPNKFSLEQKKAVWDFYEPLTLHDSTLSFGIHAWLAARLKKDVKAWDYFNKSLYLDLENVMNNTANEGLHLAALGATWQALIFGFAGLASEGDVLKVTPNLPEEWDGMRFTVFHKGIKHHVAIDKDGATIS